MNIKTILFQGDYIDLTIGSMFGISTMAAAGIGNTISDVAGVGSAQFVESFAQKVNDNKQLKFSAMLHSKILNSDTLLSWEYRNLI